MSTDAGRIKTRWCAPPDGSTQDQMGMPPDLTHPQTKNEPDQVCKPKHLIMGHARNERRSTMEGTSHSHLVQTNELLKTAMRQLGQLEY